MQLSLKAAEEKGEEERRGVEGSADKLVNAGESAPNSWFGLIKMCLEWYMGRIEKWGVRWNKIAVFSKSLFRVLLKYAASAEKESVVAV